MSVAATKLNYSMFAGKYVLPTTGILTGVSGYHPGDKVIIDPALNTKEENHVKNIFGNKILLNNSLKYNHDLSGVIDNRFQGVNEISDYQDPNASSIITPSIKKKSLSGVNSNTGSILISSTTSNTRNLIHQTINGSTNYEEIWLWAYNDSSTSVELTIEFGGNSWESNPGEGINYREDSTLKLDIPNQQGLYKIFAGLVLQNSLRITAYTNSTNKIILYGYVNEIDQSVPGTPTGQSPIKISDSTIGWGENYYGQASVPSMLSFTKEKTVKHLSAGYNNSFAVLGDDSISGWGTNNNGQLNIPSMFTPSATTTTAIHSVEKIAVGSRHVLALYKDSNQNAYIRSWGHYDENTVPLNLATVVDISAGSEHSLALLDNGTVMGWGKNDFGQAKGVPSTGLATGSFGGAVSGASGELLDDVRTIDAGSSHSIALRTDSGVVAWGSNWAGQCSVPSGATGVVQISAGLNHCLALKQDNSVVAWGDNTYNQCDTPSGLAVANTGIVGVATAGNTSLAWKGDGQVIVWGKAEKLKNSPSFKLKSVHCGVEHAIATDITGLRKNGTPVI